MKKLVLGVFGAWVLLLGGTAFAEEAVLNDPTKTVALAKTVINYLQPSYESVWDVYNGGFSQGISASLYTFTSREIPLASLRLGASTGMALYGGVSLDLPGVARRFAAVSGPVNTGPLNEVWALIGKYGRVGLVGGYSWDHEDPLIGMTIGAALTF